MENNVIHKKNEKQFIHPEIRKGEKLAGNFPVSYKEEDIENVLKRNTFRIGEKSYFPNGERKGEIMENFKPVFVLK